MLKTFSALADFFSLQGQRNKQSRHPVDYIYTVDESMAGSVRSCPPSNGDSAPVVFAYASDGPKNASRNDWLAISATMTKLVETFVLLRLTGWPLCLASSMTWLYFLLAAIMIQLSGLSRGFGSTVAEHRRQDLFVGDLPTLHGPTQGSETRVILGVPINVRRHLVWKFVWALSWLVCLASTLATFLLLQTENSAVFCIWAGFQAFWLCARYVFSHFMRSTDGRPNPVTLHKGGDQKFRLLSLAGGISRYLARLHTRTSASYLQDLHDSVDIKRHVRPAKPILKWRDGLCNENAVKKVLSALAVDASLDVEVLAVIGDTMLAGLSCIHGSGLSCLDLYDSCLMIIKLGTETFLVPSARVLSGNAAAVKVPLKDAEAGVSPRFIDKLGPCRGEDNGWVYWIPLDANRWLYFICDHNSIGVHTCEILTNQEVTRRLALGNLWVSVSKVEQLEEYVDRAALLGGVLINEYLREVPA